MQRFFEHPDTVEAIALLASAPRLTAFVGAGSSKEVGLPTWAELIDRLADRVVEGLAEDEAVQLKAFINDSGLLTAAERIQRDLDSPDMNAAIHAAIYEQDDAASVVPGPLTRAVAALKRDDPDVRIVTTNYDQLLVTALRDLGIRHAKSYCMNDPAKWAVIHLHGVLGFEEPATGPNEVVLTEHDFLAPRNGEWRRNVVEKAIDTTSCLFLGASLTDLNLLTPLHLSRKTPNPRHVVVFVRDQKLSDKARARAEEIDRSRWEALGVRVVYADNYGDVGQFVTEVRLKRRQTDRYVPLPNRLGDWQKESGSTHFPPDVDVFRSAQERLVHVLDRLLAGIQQGYRMLDGEVMQLGVFTLARGSDGSLDYATIIATSDRIMLDPRSYDVLPLDRSTQWVGVKAMMRGVSVSEERNHYASRWKHMLGVPVFARGEIEGCVGSVVLSSSSEQSSLEQIGRNGLQLADYSDLRKALAAAGQIVLGLDASTDPEVIE